MAEATKRRRYRFADRASAEDAVRERELREWLYNVALDATLNESIVWIRGTHFDVGRFGADRIDGGLYIVRHLWPGCTQRPSSRVYTPTEVESWRRTLFYPQDDEQRELANMLDQAMAVRGGSKIP